MTLRCYNEVSNNLNGFSDEPKKTHQTQTKTNTYNIMIHTTYDPHRTHPQGLRISSSIAQGRPLRSSVIYNMRTPGPPTRPPKSVGYWLSSPFLSCIPLLSNMYHLSDIDYLVNHFRV